ncbi:expressed unknown protein [Seminavis robusta]|uniref:Uncharacterized protein n=1 Tax=Seminavis robusta TaxID=568900 RepID=A0A9N8HBF2_9STRA|nr:expressed unknown protein [Seminavis robusta]|eukprot:Sro359_g126140.1 n/a (483) ;mRNA; r:54155-55603
MAGFSFGGFGSSAPAGAAPAAGAFSFGSAGPAPGVPAPAPGGFSFGPAPAAPAPSSYSFGSYGATPAPPAAAPGGFSFGSPGAAPGTAPAPYGFGPGAAAPQPGAPQQPSVISGGTPYNNLPPDIKAAIDKIHEAMMKHKRTVLGIQSIGPSQLETTPGSSTVSLPMKIKKLNETISELERMSQLQSVADSSKKEYEQLYKQATIGLWSLEQLAVQRGVQVRVRSEQKPQAETADAKAQLREVLDQQMAHVDRFERMPSQYLWQVIPDMKKRLLALERRLWTAQQQHQNALRTARPANISITIQEQQNQVHRANKYYDKLQVEMDKVRTLYRFYERGDNVLDQADHAKNKREREILNAISMQFVQASAPAGAPAVAAPAPFGQPSSTAAAPKPPTTSFGGFGFGSPAPAPATAPSTGFSFGPTPAPAAGAFTGAAPAPPVFGSTAPTTTPAPLSFGSTTSSSFSSATPKSKSKGRSKSRSGR